MTTFYSDNYSSSTTATSVEVGYKHTSRADVTLRSCRFTVPTTAADDDVIRLITVKSSDRLWDLRLSTIAAITGVGTIDIGLHKSGYNHDGAVIDVDLFASDQDIVATIARTSVFKESVTLVDVDRGKTFWELATIGAASYTEDPQESWDITATFDGSTVLTAEGVILVEADIAVVG